MKTFNEYFQSLNESIKSNFIYFSLRDVNYNSEDAKYRNSIYLNFNYDLYPIMTPKGYKESDYVGRIMWNSEQVIYDVFALNAKERSLYENPEKAYVIVSVKDKERRSLIKIDEIKNQVAILDNDLMKDQDEHLYWSRPFKKFKMLVENSRLFKMNQ